MKREGFFKDHRAKQPPVLQKDLHGKTILVVGATGGLGFEACVHLARMSPEKLIMTGRNQAKAQEATLELAKRVTFKATPAEVDLGSFTSVRSFCDTISASQKDGIDVLILNAGVAPISYSTTKDGWESQIQVNFISTAWIIMRLLPLIKGRVVVVPTDLHYDATIEGDVVSQHEGGRGILKTMSSREYYNRVASKAGYFGRMILPYVLYDKTKLLTLLFMRSLIARLPAKTDPLILAGDPGLCISGLRRSLPWYWFGTRSINWLLETALALPTEVGSRNIVFTSVSGKDEFGEGWKEKMQGSYVSFGRIGGPSDFVEGDVGGKVGDMILEETITLLRDVDPKLEQTLQNFNLRA